MCGRYSIIDDIKDIGKYFRVTNTLPAFPPSYNVAPTQQLPVVLERDGKRVLEEMEWGLIPYWSKEPQRGRNMNARAETVDKLSRWTRLPYTFPGEVAWLYGANARRVPPAPK